MLHQTNKITSNGVIACHSMHSLTAVELQYYCYLPVAVPSAVITESIIGIGDVISPTNTLTVTLTDPSLSDTVY